MLSYSLANLRRQRVAITRFFTRLGEDQVALLGAVTIEIGFILDIKHHTWAPWAFHYQNVIIPFQDVDHRAWELVIKH